ncbi:TatD family hydrolase [Candidatus Tokpelaia sp.]|uniref:TatD family hydrolase n=1 Tax=Candidatus Tokpelaia sp. TaxID=2233777 RepID=UPI00123AF36E|nr:TatD family hydrolase [Candidatus Tokpelaia sp.]KAA6404792.1 LuxR family transcriptional regulator [Candidatus Tokpelaia sp.]
MPEIDKLYWIDTHCHLDFDVFATDRAAVIARALAQNVRRQITISTRISHYAQLQALAEAWPSVFFTVGTHPCNAHEEAEQAVNIEQLLALSRHPKLVGFGEAGLDYHYSRETEAAQKRSLSLHIAAARQTQLPLIIHSRDADEDMVEILRGESAKGRFPFILHCFSSGKKLAQTGLELGGYISFSGIVTFKNADIVREAAAATPKNRLLLETDAPYLAPVPYRGQSNEPAFVVKTAEFLAEFLNMEKSALAQQTTENAYAIFKKMQPA